VLRSCAFTPDRTSSPHSFLFPCLSHPPTCPSRVSCPIQAHTLASRPPSSFLHPSLFLPSPSPSPSMPTLQNVRREGHPIRSHRPTVPQHDRSRAPLRRDRSWHVRHPSEAQSRDRARLPRRRRKGRQAGRQVLEYGAVCPVRPFFLPPFSEQVSCLSWQNEMLIGSFRCLNSASGTIELAFLRCRRDELFLMIM
jgi:hypothetical protein